MPWSPPMMFVSIVGQASFQTALRSGPSMIVRSYFRRSGPAGAGVAAAVDGAAAVAGASEGGATGFAGFREGVAVTSVMRRICGAMRAFRHGA
jgi:hypothetical protein